jgi:protein-tyrosine phosphatase
VGYVDIHSHVLYGLDDGARTADESVAMLETAATSGTTDMVATPHANGEYRFQPALVDARIAELRPRTTVRIHRGCDFHLQADNIQDALAHPERYTVNHKRYLLVEFPDMTIFPSTERILNTLLDAGLVPIITHPERNPMLRHRMDDLAKWVQNGCYAQVTAASITGLFGPRARKGADDLFQRGLVHFVASDAHDRTHRTTSLREAYAQLAADFDEALVRPLFEDNPRAVLTGAAIDFELPPGVRKRRKWYQFWK